MQKGISAVIAVILLLLITISITGIAFIFFSRTQQSVQNATEQQLQQQTSLLGTNFAIDGTSQNQVYIRNLGTNSLANLSFYVNNVPVNYIGPASLAPNDVGVYTLVNPPTGSATIVVTAGTVSKQASTIIPVPLAITSFAANPSTINLGQSSSLSWSTTSATSASILPGFPSAPTSGTQIVTPLSTTTYTLNASNGVTSLTATVTVTVNQPPVINSFTATPSSINNSQFSNLSWSITNAASASIDGGIGTVSASSGSVLANPAANTTYNLTATNFAGSAAASAQVRVSPDYSLVGYWKFDAGSGTTAADVSTNSYTATWLGTLGSQWTTGKVGPYGGNFNGVNNMLNVTAPSVINQQGNKTFIVWVYPKSTNYELDILDSWHAPQGSGCSGFEIGTRGTGLIYRSGGWIDLQISSPVYVPTNQWTHIAIVQQGSPANVYVYINGSLQASLGPYTVTANGNCDLKIGGRNSAYPGSTYGPWNGTLDDIRIYNRTLSATEIYSIYNATK
jgi:hypothetical protein